MLPWMCVDLDVHDPGAEALERLQRAAHGGVDRRLQVVEEVARDDADPQAVDAARRSAV